MVGFQPKDHSLICFVMASFVAHNIEEIVKEYMVGTNPFLLPSDMVANTLFYFTYYYEDNPPDVLENLKSALGARTCLISKYDPELDHSFEEKVSKIAEEVVLEKFKIAYSWDKANFLVLDEQTRNRFFRHPCGRI